MFRRFLVDFLVFYVRIGLRFYFRKLVVRGVEHIPANGALMFAANHQNSFLDALIIAATQPRRLHFLVRADVFRKSWASRLLRMLNMMPVFRFRDGWQSLGKNSETFDEVVRLFEQDQALLLFPEGNHSLLRRLRPLSRGFTKPLAQALQKSPNQKIFLIPAGLNFSDHKTFRSEASLYFGPPIDVRTFIENGVLDANALREKLSDEMKKLVVHIEDLNSYPQVEASLVAAGISFIDPVQTNQHISNLLSVKKDQSSKTILSQRRDNDILFRLCHYPALLGWKRIRSGIKDPVFTASLKFVYGIFAFPLYYLFVFSAVSFIVGATAAAAVVLSFILTVVARD